ncbi:MAG TPA: hypothetical protein VGI29_10990 [Candidatus Binataceae bacterium]|jgi:hypothetical protein
MKTARTTKVAGAILATAVAMAFSGRVLMAADASGTSAQQPQIKCLGANSCKGQSACKNANNSCKGQNSCKGKGFVVTIDAKSCEAKGGHLGKKSPMAM